MRLSWLDQRLTFASLVALPFILTFVFTTVKARWIKRAGSKNGEHQPPPAPYTVPVLGNTVAFATDTEGFLRRMLKRFGETPFAVLVGADKLYYVPHGQPVLEMFKNSRDMTAKPLTIVALRDSFGIAVKDLAVFFRDGSGISSKPAEGFEDYNPDHRIFHIQHRDLHLLLSGVSLDEMTSRFVAKYTGRLDKTSEIPKSSDEWAELPDLYGFLRNEMFHAATESLCGEHIFRLSPDFARQFWDFDSKMITYLRRLPRWMSPKAWRIRDEALASVKRWRKNASEKFDSQNEELANAEYEPLWGAKIMRAREIMFTKSELSDDARASLDLGMLWATNANVIPATLWALLNIYLTPGLPARVMAETSSCFDSETGSFDIAALCSKPLLTSIYHEALRYSVALTIARNPLTPDFKLAGWKMELGSLLISNPWYGGRDTGFWNTGRVAASSGRPEHPVDSFWAERFLEYPDDPVSGPTRKDESVYRSAEGKPKSIEDDKKAKVTTAGVQGHFYPYGGGSKICPGRFFAKQEMIAAVAVLMQKFEMELLDPDTARKAKPDQAFFPAGALPPDRAVPVRMKRRKL
ncbi:cytochrome P450 [Lasiosphaeris hirsuta]|uniref:Cytochrome P450 n=1 Tax=Lasiosphaeris hirsuta TaxID=260670 RepID=A0AA40AZ50_9PEZI|nr:cytochrome P450 [Lasiosphaeris hirsuta]